MFYSVSSQPQDEIVKFLHDCCRPVRRSEGMCGNTLKTAAASYMQSKGQYVEASPLLASAGVDLRGQVASSGVRVPVFAHPSWNQQGATPGLALVEQ